MTAHNLSEITFRFNNETIQPYEPRIVAWASVVIDGVLKLNEMVVWRSSDGGLVLRWPHTKSKRGKSYAVAHPIDKDFAQAVEDAILDALSAMGKAVDDARNKEGGA